MLWRSRSSEPDNLCKEPQTAAAEAPAHIVMDDMSGLPEARSSNSPRESKPRDEIKGDEDPANLTGELNILVCQEDGAGRCLDARLVLKQTSSLMSLDVTLAALRCFTVKQEKGRKKEERAALQPILLKSLIRPKEVEVDLEPRSLLVVWPQI